jgi:hypothetical protein
MSKHAFVYFFIDKGTFYKKILDNQPFILYSDSGPALSQLDQLLSNGLRAGVIYSRLFEYTQQHTACFTEKSIGPAPPKADPVPDITLVDYGREWWLLKVTFGTVVPQVFEKHHIHIDWSLEI